MPARKKSKNQKKKKLNPEQLRLRLKLKHIDSRKRILKKYPKAKKYLTIKGLDPAKIRQHSAKVLSVGAITGTILLSPSADGTVLSTPQEIIEKVSTASSVKIQKQQEILVESMKSFLPKNARPLYRNEEKLLEQLFQNLVGVEARATLEGEHLNTTYGYIGAEQHLRRHPGDTLLQHGTGEVLNEGIAPGLGAWGYFAPSKEQLTPELEETEKWYAVVQTLYLPDWDTRTRYLREWYKYRKVLIVNTENGQAVVAAIADSGPAAWTGKHFGGGPEVMRHLGGPRYKKGPVIVFFVDDPENKVPLGPVHYE